MQLPNPENGKKALELAEEALKSKDYIKAAYYYREAYELYNYVVAYTHALDALANSAIAYRKAAEAAPCGDHFLKAYCYDAAARTYRIVRFSPDTDKMFKKADESYKALLEEAKKKMDSGMYFYAYLDYKRVAEMYVEAERYEEANKLLLETAQAYQEGATRELKLGKYHLSSECCKEAANIYKRLGKHENCNEMFESAARSYESGAKSLAYYLTTELQVYYYIEAAKIYKDLCNIPKAIEMYGKAIREYEDDGIYEKAAKMEIYVTELQNITCIPNIC